MCNHIHSANNSKGGLRQMAISVMNVVKTKGVASYCEVGDALVRQLLSKNNKGMLYCIKYPPVVLHPVHRHPIRPDSYSDEKNVRRRVYDALNVLKAVDIIVPGSGRDLVWQGLPQGRGGRGATSGDHAARLVELRAQKSALLEQTKRQLDNVSVCVFPLGCAGGLCVCRDVNSSPCCLAHPPCCNTHPQQLVDYQSTLKRVLLRNAEQSPQGLCGEDEQQRDGNRLADKTIPYPFILLQTHLHNTVNIQHTEDRMQYDLDFGR